MYMAIYKCVIIIIITVIIIIISSSSSRSSVMYIFILNCSMSYIL